MDINQAINENKNSRDGGDGKCCLIQFDTHLPLPWGIHVRVHWTPLFLACGHIIATGRTAVVLASGEDTHFDGLHASEREEKQTEY